MKAHYVVSILLSISSVLLLEAGALINWPAKSSHHSFIMPSAPSINVSDCFREIKEKSQKTWQDMPLWGKGLAVGTIGGGALLLGIYALKPKSVTAQQFEKTEDVSVSEDISDVRMQPLKTLFWKNPASAMRVLTHHAPHEQKVAVLLSVMRAIISNPYTVQEAAIIDVVKQQDSFSPYDWFSLWKYACEYEHNYDTLLRNWIGANFITELYMQIGDEETVRLALESGVNTSVPVYYYDSLDKHADA